MRKYASTFVGAGLHFIFHFSAGKGLARQVLFIAAISGLSMSCSSSNNTDEPPLDDDSQPILNSDNYEQIVELVLNTYTGKNHSRAILSGDEFLRYNQPMSSTQVDSNTTVNEYSCENDGDVASTIVRTGTFRNRIEANFNNCLWRETTLNGQLVVNQRDQRFYSAAGELEFVEFTVVETNGNELLINGALTHSVENFDQNDTHVWSNTLDTLSYQYRLGWPIHCRQNANRSH